MPDTPCPPDDPGDPVAWENPTHSVPAEPRMPRLVHVSASIAAGRIVFAGLRYGSEELAAALR